jgi:hypothetical protein
MSNRNFFGGRGQRQGAGQGSGRGLGEVTKPGSGPSGTCVCPKCGYRRSHVTGERCMDLVCPKCGTRMTRE